VFDRERWIALLEVPAAGVGGQLMARKFSPMVEVLQVELQVRT